MRIVIALCLFLALSLPATAFEFKDGDHVVLIGSTLIEREQRYGYWEAAITARNPDKKITFRNLGWSGDTVWGEARAGFGTVADGYKHLVDHVRAEKPTVIIVGYGTNESFAGPEGLPKFKEQLKKLLDDLSTTKARFVLLSPMKMLKMPPPLPDPAKANENLKLYGEPIKEEAKRRKAAFWDLAEWVDHWKVISNGKPFTDCTDDGLSLNANGYAGSGLLLSKSLSDDDKLQWEAYGPPKWRVDIDLGTGRAEGAFISLNTDGKASLRFRGTAEYDVRGSMRVAGLPKGKYQLKVDGKLVLERTSEDWAAGGVPVSSPGSQERYEKLLKTIVAKNELYFHRWRPQNVTYLFGFRKHEQGNNAREIPQFDPLVAAKEKEIAELKKPREHVYELVPVKEKK